MSVHQRIERVFNRAARKKVLGVAREILNLCLMIRLSSIFRNWGKIDEQMFLMKNSHRQ